MKKTLAQRSERICRICLLPALADTPLIQPCNCVAELAYCHSSCLAKWISSTRSTVCDICRFRFRTILEFDTFFTWLHENEDELQQFYVGMFILLLSFYLAIIGEVHISTLEDSSSPLTNLFTMLTFIAQLGYLSWVAFFSHWEAKRYLDWCGSHVNITVLSNPNKKPFKSHKRSAFKEVDSSKGPKNVSPTFIEFPVKRLPRKRMDSSELEWNFDLPKYSTRKKPGRPRKGGKMDEPVKTRRRKTKGSRRTGKRSKRRRVGRSNSVRAKKNDPQKTDKEEEDEKKEEKGREEEKKPVMETLPGQEKQKKSEKGDGNEKVESDAKTDDSERSLTPKPVEPAQVGGKKSETIFSRRVTKESKESKEFAGLIATGGVATELRNNPNDEDKN